MKAIAIALGIVAVLVLLIGLFAWYFRRNYEKMSAPANFVPEAEPAESIRAKAVDKQMVMEKTRPNVVLPEHRIHTIVTFEFEGGEQKALAVCKELYDAIDVPQEGELVMQNGNVVDFLGDED